MTILAGEQPFLGIGYQRYMHQLSDDRAGIDRVSRWFRVPKKASVVGEITQTIILLGAYGLESPTLKSIDHSLAYADRQNASELSPRLTMKSRVDDSIDAEAERQYRESRSNNS
jgi:hypothetical protein